MQMLAKVLNDEIDLIASHDLLFLLLGRPKVASPDPEWPS